MAKRKKNLPTADRYSKEGFLNSEQYRRYKGILTSLLKDGKKYTVAEVENLINGFMKGQVN